MQLKIWLLVVRIINLLSAAMMIAFEIWYTVELFISDRAYLVTTIRLFTPAFMIMMAVIIVFSEFKYARVVENFKFLQSLPGLALFNLLYLCLYISIASLFAFQFSTFDDEAPPIVTASLFVCQAIVLAVLQCLKPDGTQSLLSGEE